jgi:hypothetical protein
LRILVVLALAWADIAPAEVYRCEVGGKLEFSDRPCAAGAPALELAPTNTMQAHPGDRALAEQHDKRGVASRKAQAAADADWKRAYAARKKKEAQIREGQIKGKVVAGMTASQVRSILGEPTSSQTQDGEAGSQETWTFRKDGSTQTVQFKGGQVTRVTGTTKKK